LSNLNVEGASNMQFIQKLNVTLVFEAISR